MIELIVNAVFLLVTTLLLLGLTLRAFPVLWRAYKNRENGYKTERLAYLTIVSGMICVTLGGFTTGGATEYLGFDLAEQMLTAKIIVTVGRVLIIAGGVRLIRSGCLN